MPGFLCPLAQGVRRTLWVLEEAGGGARGGGGGQSLAPPHPRSHLLPPSLPQLLELPQAPALFQLLLQLLLRFVLLQRRR